jgi:tetratricopeptide (TPR) repeat protein
MLVRGSFIAVGSDVRLDVQLIDLEDGTVTAAERSRGSDVFALVDDVSAKLSGRLLGPAFTPTELTPVTQLATGNLAAYRAYQEGLLAERRFLHEDARNLYRRAVELDSTFAIAWLRLGMEANTGQEAVSAFAKADRFKDKASERDRYLIEALFAANLRGDTGEAERLLTQLIARYPDEKDARYQLGVFYDGAGRTEEGRRVLEEAVALDPYFGPAINHLAYMAGRRGDSIAADTLSQRYLELEPGQANPHDSRGEILEMIGRHEDARDEFREALRVDPSFTPAYEHLVRSYLREGEPGEARAALQPLMDVDDDDAAVLVRSLQADTYIAEGRYQDGLAAFRRAAERAESVGRSDLRMQVLIASANLGTFTGDFAEAESEFHEAVSIDPLNGGTFLGLLVLYGEQGLLDRMRAVRDSGTVLFSSAAPLVQRQLDLIGLIADAFVALYLDDPGAAVELYDQTRDMAGAPRPALIAGVALEALALIESGRAREAVELMDHLVDMSWRANQLDPFQLQAALYLKGRAHEELGESDRAADSYQRLIDMTGPAVRQISFMSDAPDRLAALRSAPASVPTG